MSPTGIAVLVGYIVIGLILAFIPTKKGGSPYQLDLGAALILVFGWMPMLLVIWVRNRRKPQSKR